jgi:tetratricopeptide (TPR) repeat protein
MKQLVHLKSTITASARGAMTCPPLGRVFLFVAHLLACVALAPVAQAVCPAPDALATYVASYSFTANWNSLSGATYQLDVSTSSSFDTYVPGYQHLNVGNATSRNVSGLNPSTAYYFRVHKYCVALHKGAYSETVHVTTLSPTGPPVVITNRATYIASFSARLNGSVDPHGLPTTVYFQYGTTISYGLTTAIQSKTGNTYQNVAASISGLTASTTYHFRIVATNSNGTRYGADRTFTTLSATGPPVAITNPATNVASSSATLNGSVDPHGLTTNVHFQYGTTTSYGNTTANQSKTGNTYQNVAANISGLAGRTTYHFRIVATNSAGTRYGADRTFTTLRTTGPPVVITSPATNVTSSSATLNGSVDPHGLTTTVHFQYGTTTSYGLTTANQTKSGNAYQNVAANISGLSASTTYHFQIVGTNTSGTTYGSDRTFTTDWVLGDYGLAKTTFKELSKLLPGSSEIPAALGHVTQEGGHVEESIAYFEQGLVLDPRYMDLPVEAAATYAMLRQFPVALKLYDRALGVIPDDPELMAFKAAMYQAEGNLQESAKLLIDVDERTTSVTAFANKLDQLRLERNHVEAIRLLQARRAQGPSACDAFEVLHLAFAQRFVGDTAGAKATAEQARNTLEPLCKEQPDIPDLEVELALADAVLGERDSALKEAERAIMLVPSAKDAVHRPGYEEILALIQTVLGENSRAISTLTQLLKTPYGSLIYGPAPVTPALLRLDPIWDPLRSDPRFQELCEEKPSELTENK